LNERQINFERTIFEKRPDPAEDVTRLKDMTKKPERKKERKKRERERKKEKEREREKERESVRMRS
jgi:hypothetical protein